MEEYKKMLDEQNKQDQNLKQQIQDNITDQEYDDLEKSQELSYKNGLLNKISSMPKVLTAFDWQNINDLCTQDKEFDKRVELAKKGKYFKMQQSIVDEFEQQQQIQQQTQQQNSVQLYTKDNNDLISSQSSQNNYLIKQSPQQHYYQQINPFQMQSQQQIQPIVYYQQDDSKIQQLQTEIQQLQSQLNQQQQQMILMQYNDQSHLVRNLQQKVYDLQNQLSQQQQRNEQNQFQQNIFQLNKQTQELQLELEKMKLKRKEKKLQHQYQQKDSDELLVSKSSKIDVSKSNWDPNKSKIVSDDNSKTLEDYQRVSQKRDRIIDKLEQQLGIDCEDMK